MNKLSRSYFVSSIQLMLKNDDDIYIISKWIDELIGEDLLDCSDQLLLEVANEIQDNLAMFSDSNESRNDYSGFIGDSESRIIINEEISRLL
jgi:hypothetical protein